MTVAFYAAGAGTGGGTGTSVTPGLPSTPGRSGGALLAILVRNNSSAPSTATSGWTLVRSSTNGTFRQDIFIAPLGSAAPVLTWTGNSTNFAYTCYIESSIAALWTGGIGAASTGTGPSTPHTNPGLSTTQANSVLVMIDSVNTWAGSWTTIPAPFTTRTQTGGGGPGIATVLGTAVPGASGTVVGPFSTPGTATVAPWIFDIIELRFTAPVAAPSDARIHAAAIEYYAQLPRNARLGAIGLEVYGGVANARVDAVTVEVMSSIDNATFGLVHAIDINLYGLSGNAAIQGVGLDVYYLVTAPTGRGGRFFGV